MTIARLPGAVKGRRSSDHFELDLWDLGGKLPHLWVHHFNGTQGVIFVIDDLSVAYGDHLKVQSITQVRLSLGILTESRVQELLNVIHGNFSAPIAVIINKKTTVKQDEEDDDDDTYKPVEDWNNWIKVHILDKISDCK